MIEICVAKPEDFIGIREIWDEQFPADETYQNTVFSKILPLCKNYILREKGKISSIASLMPMHFSKLRGWYMFGVATRKGYEGKKLASTLLKQIITNESSNGYNFIFERPANQGLINFYLKFGFTKFIKKQEHTFETSNNNAESILRELRNKFNHRFEWGSIELLENLIALGEIERHRELLTPESLKEECFIAVKPLNNTPEYIFNEVCFCFPLE